MNNRNPVNIVCACPLGPQEDRPVEFSVFEAIRPGTPPDATILSTYHRSLLLTPTKFQPVWRRPCLFVLVSATRGPWRALLHLWIPYLVLLPDCASNSTKWLSRDLLIAGR